jgi:hypothetical protein
MAFIASPKKELGKVLDGDEEFKKQGIETF